MADDAAESALARSVRDPSAFGAFYAANGKPMLVFFQRRVFDAETAIDLTAETFAQAFAGRRGFRGRDDGAAQAWLYAIASRQLARYLRKGYAERRMRDRLGIELPAVGPEEASRIDELARTDQLRELLATNLERLPSDQRRALRLRVVDQLSYAEVATALMISEEAARARVSRALRALRRVLGPLAEQGDLT